MKEKLGLYDSGIGGISVLIGMIKEWKGGEYIYCGDNKNAPYGSRSEGELMRLAEENVRRLTESGATRIVLACNTLSVTVLEKLRAVSPVPVHGIFPPDPGAGGAVFSTPDTAAALAKKGVSAALYSLPGLAGEIEKSVPDGKKLTIPDHLKKIPKCYAKIALGCTHYRFIERELKEIFPQAEFCDGIPYLLKELKKHIKPDFFDYALSVSFIGECREVNRTVFLRYL